MEQLSIAPEDTSSSSPNDEALAKAGEAAVEAGNTHNTGKPIKPDNIPDKFWNPDTGEVNTEALLKSYQELEKSRSKPTEAPTEEKGGDPKSTDLKIESVDQARSLAQEKGIDFDALSKEYNDKGDLTQETYDALEAKGIPKSVVQQFVQGQQAQLTQQRAEALKDIGGEERFNEIVSWAKGNLQPSDINAYNKAVASGDLDVIKLAVGALNSKYIAANGNPPKTQVGGKAGTGETHIPFLSRQQYVDAVKDARYDRDPAYRNEVYKRLEASNIF